MVIAQIDEETHYQLSVFKAKQRHPTLSKAIQALLDMEKKSLDETLLDVIKRGYAMNKEKVQNYIITHYDGDQRDRLLVLLENTED